MAEPEEQQKEPDIDLWIQMQAWAETRRKQIGTGFVVLLVVIFAFYTNSHLQASKRADADAALMALDLPDPAAREQKIVPAADYLKIAQEFSGTPAAERALLLAASALFTENKYPEAETRFNEFVAQYPNSRHIDSARYGIAASQDAQNKVDQAIGSYELVISSGTRGEGLSTPESDQAKLAVALLYEQSDRASKALSYYDEIIRSPRSAYWQNEANMRRDALLKENPGLTAAEPDTSPSSTGSSTNQTDKQSLGPFPLLVPTNSAAATTNSAAPAK